VPSPLFHIHLDACWLSLEFENFVTTSLGFYRTDFVGPDGGKAEPLNHLTIKLREAGLYRSVFAQVVEAAAAGQGMRGYIEGEYIAVDHDFVTRPYDFQVPRPFRVTMRPLPPGTFRESEFHVAMCAERSDPALLRALHDMGLLTIYVPKPWGLSIVFTAQGSRTQVKRMVQGLREFMDHTGGSVNCSIKEERIVNWWISPGPVSMPPVIQDIHWNDDFPFSDAFKAIVSETRSPVREEVL
jgi:hypothetical protein